MSYTNRFFNDAYKRNILTSIHTIAPAKVIHYSSGSHRADLQPLFMTKDTHGQLNKQSMISGAPVLKHVEPDIYDGCLVFYACSERSLDYMNRTGTIDPHSHQMFDPNDAVVIGVFSG